VNVCSLVPSRAPLRTTRAGEPGTGRAAVRSALVSAALLLAVGLLVAATRPAAAASLATGDPRSVSQPSIPASCATLSASLTTSNRQFSSAAEASPPDTSRIQSALNNCAGTGKAVVLAASGASNAFLAGPLTVGGGEVLAAPARGASTAAATSTWSARASRGGTWPTRPRMTEKRRTTRG
jgi:polygalacturonase